MKKILLILLVGGLATACVSRQSADRMQSDIDSLQRQVEAKEAMIDNVFASISAITANLEEIKIREGLLTLSEKELADPASLGRMSDDLLAIDRLLAENRTRIAELEQTAQQLRKANHQISGLERLIGELNLRVKNQDEEIAALYRRIEGLNIEINLLGEQMAAKEEEVRTLMGEKENLSTFVDETTTELHRVHLLIAPEKQLLGDRVIEKRGFIGRTLVVTEQPNLNLFTEADTRLLESLTIYQKEARLITPHPEGSYSFVQSNEQKGLTESLVILDADRFWSLSKILVISHK